MKLMQPRITIELMEDEEWLYEIKYDGFRASLEWNLEEITIRSRQNQTLTHQFPEIITACKKVQAQVKDYLPLQFDGELVVLNNKYQANFNLLQRRGVLKNYSKIEQDSNARPSTFIVFDLVKLQDKLCTQDGLEKRKQLLNELFKMIEDPALQLIELFNDVTAAKRIAFTYQTEGIIAKRKNSLYHEGKLHNDWWKWKNWRTIQAILTAYDEKNDYFNLAVFHQSCILSIGKCKHGLTPEDYQSVKQLFKEKGQKKGSQYELPPAICVAVHTIGWMEGTLREPKFVALLPEKEPEECTMEMLKIDLASLPEIDVSNESKVLWPRVNVKKLALLTYLREMYPYMLPYLQERALTVIRCPDGIDKSCFFQKNVPSYAPTYIDVAKLFEKKQVICNNLETLIWFGNHGALEYHIPFQRVNESFPTEIVFDLDPPTADDFRIAVKAAFQMKHLFDQIGLQSFVKTSGNKGLHIHLPLPSKWMTYQETAIFTEAIAKTIEQDNPLLFTTERMKSERKGRVYLDYVQHGRNKTVIAPYSPRINPLATVAMPLYWKELENGTLHPEQFTLKTVPKLVFDRGCPWLFSYELARGANSHLKLIVQNGLK